MYLSFLFLIPIEMKNLLNYLKTFPLVDSKNSTKLLALLLSAITGSLLTLVIAAILIVDVSDNGKIDTDLIDLGVFLLCNAGLILGSGAGVKITEPLKDKLIKKAESEQKENKEE